MDIKMTWTICYDLDLLVLVSEKIVEEENFRITSLLYMLIVISVVVNM